MKKTNTKILLATLLAMVTVLNAGRTVVVKANYDKNAIQSTSNEVVLPKSYTTATYGTVSQRARTSPAVVRFIKSIAKNANESAQEYNLYASVTIAQAIIESGSGSSGLSRPPYHNLFGIKGTYQGQGRSWATSEDTANGYININSVFASYPNYEASLKHHDTLLRNNYFYRGTWKENTNSYKDATLWLTGRYATSRTYNIKLNRVIEDYNLTRFDSPLTQADLKWLESDSLDMWEVPSVEYTIEDIDTWANTSIEIPNKFKELVKKENVKNVSSAETNAPGIKNIDRVDLDYVNKKLSINNLYIDNIVFNPLMQETVGNAIKKEYNISNKPTKNAVVDLNSYPKDIKLNKDKESELQKAQKLVLNENSLAIVEAIHPDGDILVSMVSNEINVDVGVYKIIPKSISHIFKYVEPKYKLEKDLNKKSN